MSRNHLPGHLRARQGRAAQGPRQGATQGTRCQTAQKRRSVPPAALPRDDGHDQRTARRRRRPGGPGPLGGRPDLRDRQQERHRHARGTRNPLHAPARPARRPRRRTRPAGHHRQDGTAAKAVARLADLGPGRRAGPAPQDHRRSGPAGLLLPTRTAHGSAAPTRTPTACCANTSPRAQTFPDTARTTSTPSPTNPTTGREKPSTGPNPPKESSSCSTPCNTLNKANNHNDMLQQPLESADCEPCTRMMSQHHAYAGNLLTGKNIYCLPVAGSVKSCAAPANGRSRSFRYCIPSAKEMSSSCST